MASISVSWSHSSAALSAWLDSRTGEKVRVTLTFFKSSAGPPLFALSVVAERMQGVLVSDMLSSSTRDASNLDEKLPVSAKCCSDGRWGRGKQEGGTWGQGAGGEQQGSRASGMHRCSGHEMQGHSASNEQIGCSLPIQLLGAEVLPDIPATKVLNLGLLVVASMRRLQQLPPTHPDRKCRASTPAPPCHQTLAVHALQLTCFMSVANTRSITLRRMSTRICAAKQGPGKGKQEGERSGPILLRRKRDSDQGEKKMLCSFGACCQGATQLASDKHKAVAGAQGVPGEHATCSSCWGRGGLVSLP